MSKTLEDVLRNNISCEYHHREEIKKTVEAIKHYIQERIEGLKVKRFGGREFVFKDDVLQSLDIK